MGMFDDFGLESDDVKEPGNIEPGQYDATVFGFEFADQKPKDNKSHLNPDGTVKKNLVITYKITDTGDTVREYKSANLLDDNKTKGWLKARLKSLGIPESKIPTLIPADVLGTPVYIQVVKKNGYTNVSQVNAKSLVQAATSAPVSAGAKADW